METAEFGDGKLALLLLAPASEDRYQLPVLRVMTDSSPTGEVIILTRGVLRNLANNIHGTQQIANHSQLQQESWAWGSVGT